MGNTRTHLKVYRLADGNRLRQAVNLFLLDCEARNLTPATLRFYWQRLGLFVGYAERAGVTTPAAITPALLRAYLLDFRERQLSPYYQHQHARALRTLCNFWVRDGLLADSPMRTVRAPKLPRDVLPPFTADDVRALLDACEQERDAALVLTLLDSGLRASELIVLNVGDVDLTTGAVRVRRGKGGKTRIVFTGARTRKAIMRYLMTRASPPADAPLFVTLTTGTRLAFYGLQSLLGRLGRAAGVKPMGAHRFRRTFAIESLRAGMPLPQLAALMGHEGLAVLQRYLRLVDEDLRAAHAAHGAVDRLLDTKGR